MSHWARIGERGSLRGMQAMVFIQRRLGRWPFLLVLRPVILWYFLSHRTARRASADYLCRLDPSLERRPFALFWQSYRHFLQFGDALMDKVAAWSDSIGEDRLRGDGFRHFGEAIRAGRGGIVLVAHHGNLDIANALARYHPELDLTVMMHTRNAGKFNALLERVTGQPRPNVLEVTEIGPATAQELAERIQRGGFVVIAADRIPITGARLRQLSFLGDNAAFPEGPFLLAMLLRCPLYTLSCVRDDQGFQIDFELFDDLTDLPRKARDAWIGRAMPRFADQLAVRVRQHPLQWFNFYPFWQSDTGNTHDDNA
ncbi:LpxL/LpxP family acyltransferase [Pseudomonas saliphila]|uniref:LpxL/LpxP family acyltransferase n=1 Tax=Pseudomonas saliphila TaxID=2586906 RepID=UPI00123ABE80|nr:glycosyl transferase [Pseudomonas saliphila]